MMMGTVLDEKSHVVDREKALASVAKELAAELRLTDVVDLITFIRTENHPNINDLVNSSAELYLKPGTLSYGWAAEVDMRWTGKPKVKLDLEFQHRQVTAFFKLILEPSQAGVELRHVEFEAPSTASDNTMRLIEAVADARLTERARAQT
jgi:hypothetical protein